MKPLKKIRPVDIFNFQYWTDYRFSPDCFASDPMQQPLEQILSLSKKIYDIREVTIDSYNEIEQLRNTDPFKTPQFRNLYK